MIRISRKIKQSCYHSLRSDIRMFGKCWEAIKVRVKSLALCATYVHDAHVFRMSLPELHGGTSIIYKANAMLFAKPQLM